MFSIASGLTRRVSILFEVRLLDFPCIPSFNACLRTSIQTTFTFSRKVFILDCCNLLGGFLQKMGSCISAHFWLFEWPFLLEFPKRGSALCNALCRSISSLIGEHQLLLLLRTPFQYFTTPFQPLIFSF